MKQLLSQIGARLRDWRENEMEKDSKTVASMCDLSPAMYCQIEKGERGPSVSTLSALHDATGVNLHWLITGKETP